MNKNPPHCHFYFRGPLARCATSQVRRPVVAGLWGFYWSGIGLEEGVTRDRNATGPIATMNAKLIDGECETNVMRV